MCDCKSSNRPEVTGPVLPIALDQARYFPDTKMPTVYVDACIADVVERLWRAGVRTGGCCCGHNGLFGVPSIFLKRADDAVTARRVLASDKREWHVLFWAGADTSSAEAA